METAVLIISALCAAVGVITLVFAKKAASNDSSEKVNELEKRIAELSVRFDDVGRNMESSDRRLAEEFHRSRTETAAQQQNMREELSRSLTQMNEKISALTEAGYENHRKLTESVRVSLDSIREGNAQQNDRQSKIIEAAINSMQESNEKKLDAMRETVDEKLSSTLTTRLDSSFKTVSQQLENLYKSLGEMKELSTGVTDNISSLNRVLTNVKARGTWAEVQLEAILDQTIPKMYDKNVETVKNSGKRVEFAVRIPSGNDAEKFTYLPIDSKFPMEDYIRLCDAADNGDAPALEAARKALEARIKGEAKEIKKYISEPATTPFAILYLPTEGLYAEVASSRTGLPEKLLDENIMIAGPTTITALLNSLAIGFKAVTINEKANEVRKLLAAAKAQYGKFGGILEKAKKKITEAGVALDDAQKRNDLISSRLRTVEDVSEGESAAFFGIPENTEEE